MNWIAQHAWAEIWAMAWHFGIIGLIAIAAGLMVWFDLFRKQALYVLVGAVSLLLILPIYVHLGARYVQAKWDIEAAAAVKASQDARHRAEIQFPIGPDVPHARVLPNDPWDRDQSKRPSTLANRVRAAAHLQRVKGHVDHR